MLKDNNKQLIEAEVTIFTKDWYWIKPFLGVLLLAVMTALAMSDKKWWWSGPLVVLLAEVRLLASSFKVDFKAEVVDGWLVVVADGRKLRLNLGKISTIKLHKRYGLLPPLIRIETWESTDDFIEIPISLVMEGDLSRLLKVVKKHNDQITLDEDVGVFLNKGWNLKQRIKYFWGEKLAVMVLALIIVALGVGTRMW